MVLASRRRAVKSANCGIDIIRIHFAGKERGLYGHKEQLEKGIDSGISHANVANIMMTPWTKVK